jgi:AcrR family transcriptional regulator
MKRQINSKKYYSIIENARELFWKHGFRRVTLQEICDKANVSKMTFYKYFPNKTELAKKVFSDVIDEGMEKYNRIMQEDTPASEKIKGIVMLKEEGTKNISPEFMQDFYTGQEPELKFFVEEKTKEVWENLLQDMKEAQKKGIFREDFKPEMLFRVAFKVQKLIQEEELVKMYDSTQDFILELTKFIAYGISKR